VQAAADEGRWGAFLNLIKIERVSIGKGLTGDRQQANGHEQILEAIDARRQKVFD
jgi:hypothetical protein